MESFSQARAWIFFFLNAGLLFLLYRESVGGSILLGAWPLSALNYFLLKRTLVSGSGSGSRWERPVQLFPVGLLIFYKILIAHTTLQIMGFSYLTLRLWRFNIEAQTQRFEIPTLPRYFAFLFFYPTLVVGPINSYAEFTRFKLPNRTEAWENVLRIVIGSGKFIVIAPILSRLDFTNLWHEGRLHGVFDFLVSGSAYYLFLYCNFSGFTDIMIGVAKLCGFELPENFDAPLWSRNIKEFWNRWHITLSKLVRDALFTPLSKFFVRHFGPARIDIAIALAIFISFAVVGCWHGNGLNYLFFGLWHGAGLALNHFYTVWLKKRLGKSGFKAYEANRAIRVAGIIVTFCFVSCSFFFFENDWENMKVIISNMAAFYGL